MVLNDRWIQAHESSTENKNSTDTALSRMLH